MERTVLQQIDELDRMSMADLRKRWQALFGADGSRFGRGYLIRRLAYRIQELAFGGLSREARRTLKNIADGKASRADLSIRRRKQAGLTCGTRLLREWHGQRHEVVVKEDGFLYGGKTYRSLSAVARAITGTAWSGNRFFGLLETSPRKRKNR